jgi:uncharacterized protein
MKTISPVKPDACCSATAPVLSHEPARHRQRALWALGAALTLWWLAYRNLEWAAAWFTHDFCGVPIDSPMGSALGFFVYETPKVLMLLGLIVFFVGIVRSFFSPDRTRRILAGKRESVGNVLAALLGIVTPFCSCSAVPLFIGFVSTGIPLGVTFSFLIAAPMVNEVALVLLFGLFGWKVAAIYLGTGLCIAIGCGWLIGRMKMEKHVESWVYQIHSSEAGPEDVMDFPARMLLGLAAIRDIVGRVWPYILIGIAVGAGIHGYVPENFMASIMGKGAWWSVPLAVVMGVPMYSNAAGIIPIVQALLGKGAALGTVLAFMMSVIALSLPEAIILRKVLKPRLIAVFFAVVAGGIILVGFLFNLLIH